MKPMPLFVTGDSHLYYRWEGAKEGPVLVLSHSLGCSCEMWRGQAKTLGDRFRILLYDHRGHGRSGMPAGDWKMDDFGRDLMALLDHLGLEGVTFCGLSLGGMVGMWLALQAPERIERMVLCNTSAKTEDPSLLRNRIGMIEKRGLGAIVENVLEKWFTDGFRARCPERVAEIRTLLETTSGESYTATSRAICDLNLTSGLAQINVPTLVIYGAHDLATPAAWNVAIAEAIPGATAVELPAAHLSNIEAEKDFNRVVRDFFRQDDGRQNNESQNRFPG